MSTSTASSQPIVIKTQKADAIAQYQALLDGLSGPDLQGLDPIVLDGAPWPRAALIAKIQQRLDAAKDTAAARSNLALAVAAEKTLAAETTPLRLDLKQVLKTQLGKHSPKMQAFGFAPDKAREQTAASKAAAAAKNRATRAAKKAALQAVASAAAARRSGT